MEHKGDQFDRKTIQKEHQHQESEAVDTERIAALSDERALEGDQSKTDLKSLMSSSIRHYAHKESDVADAQVIKSLSDGQPKDHEQSEINLKSVVGTFIFTYIFFLVFFEMVAVVIAIWAGLDEMVLLSSCLIGLVSAFFLAYYIGWTDVSKENEYKALHREYIASVIFYGIAIPLVPFMILFGICG